MGIFNVTNGNDSGTGSLRSAIEAANSTPGLDTISVDISEITIANALLVTDSVVIKGSGVVITQTGSDRLFTVDDNDEQNVIDVTLSNINFTGGEADLGGAVFNNENLQINNSSFFGNIATKRGGAIYTEGLLSVKNSEVTDNIVIPEDSEGAAAGGGIYARFGGELKLTGSTVSNNEALVGGGIIIADGSTATITESVISDNFGTGVLAIVNSHIEITNTTLTGNQTETSGGGVAVQGNSTATVYESQITDNYAAFGGGLSAVDYSRLEVISSTISGNVADEDGGAIDLYNNSELILVGSTVSGNSALLTSGISNYKGISSIEITDSIITDAVEGNVLITETPVIETDASEEPVIEEPVVEEPVDEAPTVSEPIPDLIVEENAKNTVIDLSNLFTDIDNDDAAIVKTIAFNDKPELVDASIEGDLLTLDYLENASGLAKITIQGESNGKTVTDVFAIDIKERIFNGTDEGDDIEANDGNNILNGYSGNDLLFGFGGNDTINGGRGFDRLDGGTGNDLLDGGEQINVLTGGTGEDVFVVNDRAIDWVIDFELGQDIISFSDDISYDSLEITGTVNSFISHEGTQIAVLLGVDSTELTADNFSMAIADNNLIGSSIGELLDGSAEADIIKGESGNDILNGNDGNDLMFGGDGDDILMGGFGFDRLSGGAGDDVLNGGDGFSVLNGGEGQDVFVIDKLAVDWIEDFEVSQDKISVEGSSINYGSLEITGTVNSFISYEGERIAVLLGVDSEDLTANSFDGASAELGAG